MRLSELFIVFFTMAIIAVFSSCSGAAQMNEVGIKDLNGDRLLVGADGSLNVNTVATVGSVASGTFTVINGIGTAAVNIKDGGNSITVDGAFWQTTQPVSITGTGGTAYTYVASGLTGLYTTPMQRTRFQSATGTVTAASATTFTCPFTSPNCSSFTIVNEHTASVRVDINMAATATSGIYLGTLGNYTVENGNITSLSVWAPTGGGNAAISVMWGAY